MWMGHGLDPPREGEIDMWRPRRLRRWLKNENHTRPEDLIKIPIITQRVFQLLHSNIFYHLQASRFLSQDRESAITISADTASYN